MRLSISLLFLSLLFASCEDFFDQVIDIDPPAYERQMVVNCVADNLDSTLRISISRNIGLLESLPDSLVSLRGATIVFLENGQAKHTFKLDSLRDSLPSWFTGIEFRFYGADLKMPFITPGSSYELRISHPDFTSVSATQIAPALPQMDTAKVRIDSSNSNFGDEAVFTLELVDPPGEHFYEIEILGDDGNSNYGLYSDDPNVESGLGYSKLLLSDRHFSGNKYTLRVKSSDAYSDFWTVRMRSVTADYFRFSRAVPLNEEADYNPFANPVQIPSNVENGLGLFGLAGTTERVIFK